MTMKPLRAFVLAVGAAVLIAPLRFAGTAPPPRRRRRTKSSTPMSAASTGSRSAPTSSRKRYFCWVGKNGPTGKERIIYGTYTIYDTSDCRKNVEKANALEPRDAALEAAASAYVDAVSKLEPLLKEADDYYSQEDYKDDRMAKGRALHPRLVAAWDAFASADKALRGGVEAINDKRAAERLAEIESKEGRKARYHVEALMIHAKRVLRAQDTREARRRRDHAGAERVRKHRQGGRAISGADEAKIGSFFIGNAKSFLTTAKQLMRRIRDKVPYSRRPDDAHRAAAAGWSRAPRRACYATTIN